MQYNFGVIGLGVMGQNLALNIESKGFRVAGFDLDETKAKAASAKWSGKNMTTVKSLAELAQVLERPRRILVMVPAGKPVDAVIQDLKPHLEKDDVIIDGGNSFFKDTDRRGKELEPLGINYIGTGVSGGEEGALKGPSIMPGGQKAAYDHVAPILTSIAAKTDDGPCAAYIGKGGAGHYVKMVHNGIEYGIMELLSEAYDVLKSTLGLSAPEMAEIFAAWNKTELNSYLVEITAAVLAKMDPDTGKPLVDVIVDKAGQKGTGKWTSQNAMDLGIAIPTINAALEGRILSGARDERIAASKILTGPKPKFEGNREELVETLRKALRLAIITCYAQGFALMREASKEYGYDLHLAEIARIWKGGCIIRAKLLEPIKQAFLANSDLVNLMIDERFAPAVNELSASLRTVCAKAAEFGIPTLGLFASLGYIDAYRRERMPANLLQGQRDYFGAHRYERIDRPKGETFHTEWAV